MSAPWETLKLLADATRLRTLALLAEGELSVAELQEILEMGQSRISTHLGQLRQAGLVLDRREGKRTYYGLHPRLPAGARELVAAALASARGDEQMRADALALRRVLDKRQAAAERYFNEVAGRLGRDYCPGRSWEGLGQLFLELLPPLEVADLGAGEGLLSHLLARRAKHVWCIDNSPKMVEVGSELARRHGVENLTYQLGDIERVPLAEASVEVAVLSQALHHARQPQHALDEAARILRPGGLCVVLDLREHTFEKARELYADVWLGFREGALLEMLGRAGLRGAEARVVARETAEPFFETVLALARKPAE